MSVNHSIVPRLTRADLLTIAAWTETNKRSREAYRRDPFAAARELEHQRLKSMRGWASLSLAEYRSRMAEVASW